LRPERLTRSGSRDDAHRSDRLERVTALVVRFLRRHRVRTEDLPRLIEIAYAKLSRLDHDSPGAELRAAPATIMFGPPAARRAARPGGDGRPGWRRPAATDRGPRTRGAPYSR